MSSKLYKSYFKSLVIRAEIGFEVWFSFESPPIHVSDIKTIKESIHHQNKLLCLLSVRIPKVGQCITHSLAQNLDSNKLLNKTKDKVCAARSTLIFE